MAFPSCDRHVHLAEIKESRRPSDMTVGTPSTNMDRILLALAISEDKFGEAPSLTVWAGEELKMHSVFSHIGGWPCTRPH